MAERELLAHLSSMGDNHGWRFCVFPSSTNDLPDFGMVPLSSGSSSDWTVFNTATRVITNTLDVASWTLRISHGPGYRLYYVQRGDVLVVLLCGGDKSSQATDIRKAHALAERL